MAGLSRQRRFVTPGPDETVEELAARAMPGEPLESAGQCVAMPATTAAGAALPW